MENTISQTVNGFERILTLIPPFDRRNPDPSKSYGIGGMNLRMVLVKDKRAVQFIAYLPLYLEHVTRELQGTSDFQGMGADVGYHSPEPMYEGQELTLDKCPYTQGKCYYGGSTLRAQEWYSDFRNDGMDVIWNKLENEWTSLFEGEIK